VDDEADVDVYGDAPLRTFESSTISMNGESYEEDFYEDDQQSLNSVTSADSRASSSSVSIKCMYVLHSVLAMTKQFCF